MERRQKIILALAIGAVLILLGSSIVRCSMTSSEQAGHDVPAAGETTNTSSESGAIAGVNANASQQKLPQTEPDALGTLKGNPWTSEDGARSITFKDGRYVESDGVITSMATFDVSAVSAESGQTSIFLKLDQPDGSTKDSLVLIRQDLFGSYTVSSDDFTLEKTYHQGTANQSPLAVEGVNDEFRELLGGTTDALGAAISDYAHAYVPTATKAVWAQSLVVDYASGTVSANFTCDDAAATVLTVEYARGPSTFTVMG